MSILFGLGEKVFKWVKVMKRKWKKGVKRNLNIYIQDI